MCDMRGMRDVQDVRDVRQMRDMGRRFFMPARRAGEGDYK